MKKLLNYRPLAFIALFIADGIIFTYSFYFQKISLIIILAIINVSTLVFFSISRKRLIFCFMSFFSILIGCFLFIGQYNKAVSFNVNYGDVIIDGRITDICEISKNGYAFAVLEDIAITSKDGISVKLKGKLTFSNQILSIFIPNFTVGSRIKFEGHLDGVNMFKDDINAYAYTNEMYYEITNYRTVLDITTGEINIWEKSRMYVRQLLKENISEENYPIALALLIGDKSQMDGYTKQMYRNAGVAHIFAVSGLHVGFVVMVLNFLLGLLRVNRKLSLAIIVFPLLIYGAICGFPSSVMRAIIMCLAMLIVKCFFSNTDMFSTIALAVLIILSINSMYLFDAGFLMSFASVYSIAAFAPCFTSKLKRQGKTKLVAFLTPITISICVTIGTFPFVALFYGQVSLIGVFVNIVFVPIVTIVFISIILGLIPFLSFSLLLSDFLLSFVDNIIRLINTTDAITLSVSALGYGLPILMILLFVVGGNINLTKKSKAICSIVLVVALIGTSLIAVFKSNDYFVYYNERYNTIVMSDDDNNCEIISNISSYGDNNVIKDIAKRYFYKTIKIHIVQASLIDFYLLEELLRTNNEIKQVYIYQGLLQDNIIKLFNNYEISVTYVPFNYSTKGNIVVSSVVSGNKIQALKIKMKDATFALTYIDSNQTYNDCSIKLADCSFIFANAYSNKLSNDLKNSIVIDTSLEDSHYKFSVKQLGNFTISFKGDKIILNVNYGGII